jgi:L-threonylcarbamoyladenylate synthase
VKTINFHPENFKEIFHFLESGFSLILPTETSYGFSGSIESFSAKFTVESIKKRIDKPFIILVNSFEEISKFGKVKDLDLIKNLTKETPTTFLLEKTKEVPKNYFPNFKNIAIRIPSFKPLLGFLNYYKKPIFSTSANFTGENPIYKHDEIIEKFSKFPELVFASSGDLPFNKPSRILEINNENKVNVIRS